MAGFLQRLFGSKKSEDKDIDPNVLIDSYCKLLESPGPMLRDELELPTSKRIIGNVLLLAIAQTNEGEQREAAKAVYVSLGNFLPLTDQDKIAISRFEGAMSNHNSLNADNLVDEISTYGAVYTELQRRAADSRAALLKNLNYLDSKERG